MNRQELQRYISEVYSTAPEFPWIKYPNYAVFRHQNNQKWFAAILEVPKSKLGLQGEGTLEIVNLKCDPAMVGSLRSEPGFFPAYHMNKENWISIALDDSVQGSKIKALLEISYDITNSKRHRASKA